MIFGKICVKGERKLRIKSLLLAVLMILTSFNITVFAAEGENPASLDDIAWEDFTYRDIFIENNLAYVDGFNEKDWGSFVQNTGTNEITSEEFYTAPYSLKTFGNVSTQLKGNILIPEEGNYFAAAKVNCLRYVQGTLGICIYSTSVGATGVTEGFVTASDIISERKNAGIFLGSFHSADLDGYVDDPAVVNMAIFEKEPSLEEMTELYDNYVEIEKAREREEIKYTYVDSANTGKTVTAENSGYKRIDCSTFVRYVINGIDYYSTPYYNALENTDVEQGGLENGKEVSSDDATVCRTGEMYIRTGKKLILESKNSNYSFTKIFGYDADGKVIQTMESPAENKTFVPDDGVVCLRAEMKVSGESDYAPASEETPAAILKCLRIREDERLEINAEVPFSGYRNANEICKWFDENGYAVEIDKENFNPDDLRIGSVIFWGRSTGTWAYKNITHTSLYIGDGYILHVSAPYGLVGGEGILIEHIDVLMERYDIPLVAVSSPEYHNAESESPCGSSAFWKIEDGVLKISGTGAISDYSTTSEIPWYGRREEITALEIEEGITAIGKRNFAGLENLVSVSLPESLEKIGDYAFWNCSSLYDISLPENLNGIGAGAFFGCSALDYIVIPSGVTVLEQSVFAQCEKLDTVVLHDGITEIKKEAFSRCYGLFHFAMPSELETIGYHAFFGCANLQQLTFEENIRKIEDAAFYGCANLSVLRFSGNSPEFSEKAFLDITADIFYPLGDESWTETVKQNYGGTISWYSECYHNYEAEITEPTCVLEGFTTHICKICGDSYVDTYTEPTGHSFGDWETVKEATFTEDGTESRTCIKCSHVEYRSVPLTVIASGNFGYGTEPTNKVIYTIYSNGTMTVEGEGALFGCAWDGKYQPFIEYRKQVRHLIIGEGITSTTSGSFAYFSNLETVSFPSTLTKIPNNGFMSAFAESVTSITIPETVIQIGAYSFGHYGGDPSAYFTDVIIENPDIKITDHKAVFNGGSKLDKLTLYSYGAENNVSEYAEKYGIRYIDLNNYSTGEFGGIKYFYYNGVLTLSTDSEGVSIPSGNAPWNEHKNDITKIVIESGITGISENAFVNYPLLEEVEIPDSLKSIGNGAFTVTEGESAPLSMTIPRRIETLGEDIFKGRENVTVTAYYGSIAENFDEPGVNLNLKKIFKILFIGNSYTEDATCCGQKMPDSQLFNAMQAMLGEDAEVVLGVIVSGGKGINWHATQADRGNKSYTLVTMSSNDKTWKPQGAVTSMDALAFTDWDAVSLQVYSLNVNTGEESVSYPEQTDPKFYKLETASEFMLDLFAEYAPYADAYFYMHWKGTSAININAGLSGYNKTADYIPVVLGYKGTESGKQFKTIVPVGLSIQNARTTYLALLRYNTTAYADGNLNLVTDAQIGLQRDGGHVSFNIGRYIAGLTFAEMVIPEEMREEGYVLPDIRITESIGKLPKEYTEIAQKSVFAAVESWKNGSLAVTEIEGYKVDPVDTESEKLAEEKLSVPYAADMESLKARITEAVLAALPEDFSVESVEFTEDFEITGEGQEFEAEIEIRFGYMFKKVPVNFAVEKALYGDLNLDGSVDVKDVYVARLVAAKLYVPTEQQILIGDVDLDRKITAIDANLIRKFAAKIIEKLPVEA